MLRTLSLVCFGVLAALDSVAVAQDLQVEHALSTDGLELTFSPRGLLKRSEKGSTFEQEKFTSKEADQIKALVESDSYYHIRVPAHPGKDDGEYVQSLVRACTLVSSKLKDELGIHMNELGDVVALEYHPSNTTCANKFFAKKIVEGSTFKTTIKLRSRGMPGPSIATAEFVTPVAENIVYDDEGKPVKQKAGAASANPDDADTPPESFFQKYWMYIVPAIVLFNLMTTPSPAAETPADGAAPAAEGGGNRRN
eukprot:CFRG0475T1